MIYADANVLIYLIEDPSARGDEVRRRFAHSRGEIAVSPLVALECKVRPLRNKDVVLTRYFDRALSGLRMLTLPPEVYELALDLAATEGLNTIDALHLAAAQFHHCDEFWTYDVRLKAAAGGMAIETF